MKHSYLLRGAAMLGSIAIVVTIAYASSEATPDKSATAPAVQLTTPATLRPAQLELVRAQRYTVTKPYQHVWRRDTPMVTDGWMLVLEGSPEQLKPHQAPDPILYVGNQTAERINHGLSGRLVVLVPGDFKLADAPIFLGTVGLPEEVLPAKIADELANAVAAGAVAPDAATITKVVVAETMNFPTDYELRLRAIDLVEEHSPHETDLIQGWRAPLVR